MHECSAERIQHMIGDLLDLAREREGAGIRIERKRTGLSAVCRQIIDELKVNSENDETMFRLVLPRQRPTALAHVLT